MLGDLGDRYFLVFGEGWVVGEVGMVVWGWVFVSWRLGWVRWRV